MPAAPSSISRVAPGPPKGVFTWPGLRVEDAGQAVQAALAEAVTRVEAAHAAQAAHATAHVDQVAAALLEQRHECLGHGERPDDVVGKGPGADVGEAYVDLLVGDFDGDSEGEVLARGEDTGAITLHRRDRCDGTWTTSVVADSPLFEPAAVGDLNGDGLADVIGWNEDLVGVTGLSQGDGTFAWQTGAFDPSVAWSNYIMIAAYHAVDVTRDAVADLVLVEYDSHASASTGVHVLAGRGDGTFGVAEHVGELDEASNGADLADVDGDGHNDLVAGLDDDGDAGVVYLLRGTPTGLGGAEVLLDLEPGSESGTNHPGQGSLYLWDWDGDGDPDLLSAHRLHSGDFKSAVLDLMENHGTGRFGALSPVLGESEMPAGLYLAVP